MSVEVTDTGPGIDPAVAARLFTPFVTTKPTGTGLGLTVARRVARDHGGTLTAANRPEGGARFTLTLPAAEDATCRSCWSLTTSRSSATRSAGRSPGRTWRC